MIGGRREIPHRDTSFHQDSAGTVPSGTPPPAWAVVPWAEQKGAALGRSQAQMVRGEGSRAVAARGLAPKRCEKTRETSRPRRENRDGY